MPIAALYDIHGNLAALDAVLDEVRAAGVDRVIVGGDVMPGPMVRETMGRLDSLDVPVDFIVGNCEVAVLAARAGNDPGPMPPDAREMIEWTAQLLDQKSERWIASWPKTYRLDVPGTGAVLFCHGTPRHENEIFLRVTEEERLLPVFEPLQVDLVVCGHTHMPFDRMVGRTRVVNAGSVGMPFGTPGADWLLLGPHVELRHTSYDLERAAEQIAAVAHEPSRVAFERAILTPPSEQAMLDLYAPAALKYEPAV